MNEPKQVLVWRTDLRNTKGQKVRSGKMVAQLAHASLGVILNMMDREETTKMDRSVPVTMFSLCAVGCIRDWLVGRFTKICVTVSSEEELLKVYEEAKIRGIPCVLITDSGLTEFGGKPTNTCVGIGPWTSRDIDEVTGHLMLL